MSEPMIRLPSSDLFGRQDVGDCRWKIRTFVERDAYGDYDYAAGYLHHSPEMITRDQVHAMNCAMMARSSGTAWERFVEGPLDELRAIGVMADLVEGSDEEVTAGNEILKPLARRLMTVSGIAEVAATYVVHLLRTRFMSLCSPYIRLCLGVPDSETQSPENRIQTVLAVQRGMRRLAKANREPLDELSAYAEEISPATCRKGAYAGQAIPVKLSKLRILDIVLWSEVAIHVARQSAWSGWYTEEIAS